MNKINFKGYVADLAAKCGTKDLIPVMEKELIHYEIIKSLRRHGLLEKMTFQGGTCLRLLYGSPRYSEDLDFACGEAFDDISVAEMKEGLSDDLLSAFDTSVRVKAPKKIPQSDNVKVSKYQVIVDTDTSRPDLPSQRIKIELASVIPYTYDVRPLSCNYDILPSSYENILVPAETPTEIVADKLVSFANSSHTRYRDIWDICWVVDTYDVNVDELTDLTFLKINEYETNSDYSDFLAWGKKRLADVIHTNDFSQQMARFLSPDEYEQTIRDPSFISKMEDTVCSLYNIVNKSDPGLTLE